MKVVPQTEIPPLDGEVAESDQLRIRLDPKLTLKVALDTHKIEVFNYVLEVGCCFLDTQNGTFEEFVDFI